jgi:hypothetical protein
MSDEEIEKRRKYKWKLYKDLSKENYLLAKENHVDAVNNYNQNDRALNNRLFWFSGIAISILPITIATESMRPDSTLEIVFFIIFVGLLALSIILGIVNHFVEANFWKDNFERWGLDMESWDKPRNLSLNPDYTPEKEFNACLKYEEGLFAKTNKQASTIIQTSQIITVILGFILEVIYILIKLI